MKKVVLFICVIITCLSCVFFGACSKVKDSDIIEKCYGWSIYFDKNERKADKITISRSKVCEQSDEVEREIYICVFQNDECIEFFYGYTYSKQVYIFYHVPNPLNADYTQRLT